MSSQIDDLPETRQILPESVDIVKSSSLEDQPEPSLEAKELERLQQEERNRKWQEEREALEAEAREAEERRLEEEEQARQEWKALMEELDVYDAALMASNLILLAAYLIGAIGVGLIVLGWFVAQTDNAGAMVILAGISLIMTWLCLVSVGSDLQKDTIRLHPKCVSYYASQKQASQEEAPEGGKSKKSPKGKKGKKRK